MGLISFGSNVCVEPQEPQAPQALEPVTPELIQPPGLEKGDWPAAHQVQVEVETAREGFQPPPFSEGPVELS